MNPKDTPELDAAGLVALRGEPDALKVITERLRVKQMGPADHIRTKHEVKAFLESGGTAAEAQAIVVRARARRQLQQTHAVTQRMDERQRPSQRQDL